MGFCLFMLAMDTLVSLTMIGFGRRFMQRPPREINAWFGYRTARSMQNQDTWAFAHACCAKIWWVCGWICPPVSARTMLWALGRSKAAVAGWGVLVCMLQLVARIASIFWTERALRTHVDSVGNRT